LDFNKQRVKEVVQGSSNPPLIRRATNLLDSTFRKGYEPTEFILWNSSVNTRIEHTESIIDQIGQEILKQTFGTTDYFSYLAAGMLSFIVLFTSMQSGMSMVWDRKVRSIGIGF
jgi:hypothetical protein